MYSTHLRTLTPVGYIPILPFFLLVSCGNSDQSTTKAPAPATMANKVAEESLTTLHLSPQAEQRLGIETHAATTQNIARTIKIGGEVIALPGKEVRVAAPVAGTVLGARIETPLRSGSFVRKGQEVMRLVLMPSEKELLSTQEEVEVKQVEYEVAAAQAKRFEQLLTDKAISEKSYQETQAGLARAKAELNAAWGRLNLLRNTDLDSAAGNLSTLTLNSSLDGVIQSIAVAPGQTIPLSTVMFEVASIDPVWIRVPVYIGYLEDIDRERDAILSPMRTEGGEKIYQAQPVQGPPLSDVDNASADLYYEMRNEGGLFRIGQKVSVILPQKSLETSLVVLWSAVLYDMYGGNWVYVKTGPQTYIRQRVEVSHIVDELAVLTRGVQSGDEVVTAGAVELFGTEFGGGK